MTDAIELLLQDKPHPAAQDLLSFHHQNPDFLPRVVAEFRLLKRLGRKAGGAKALFHFLRWEQHWHAIDDFEINDHLRPLAIRVCALLWPDINGMMQFRRCASDSILDTHIVRRGSRYGNFLYPGERTLSGGCKFLPPEREGAGKVRHVQLADGTVIPTPPVPVLNRAATLHRPILEEEALKIVAPLRSLIAESPHPRNPILRAWLRHAEKQPEIFAFMENTLLQRQPDCFSAQSILEYARSSVRRAAASPKRFTLPRNVGGLYCRALVLLNPEFNGRCEFREDSDGRSKEGHCNELLGCTLASETVNGEPYRRLLGPGESQ